MQGGRGGREGARHAGPARRGGGSRASGPDRRGEAPRSLVGEDIPPTARAQSCHMQSARPQPLPAVALRGVPRPQAGGGDLGRPRRVPERLHPGEGQVRSGTGVAPRRHRRAPLPPARRLLPFPTLHLLVYQAAGRGRGRADDGGGGVPGVPPLRPHLHGGPAVPQMHGARAGQRPRKEAMHRPQLLPSTWESRYTLTHGKPVHHIDEQLVME